ncbi:MAG: hypothetical protein JSV88_31185 [Candidatus Aminicenantes bacterium]|nr:MAG: hypothetical protein JSV88_31185 [Candidatus Aminicenantes bacterium]
MKKTHVFASCVLLSLFFVVGTSANAGISDWELKSVSDVDDNPKLVNFIWETLRPPYGALDKVTLHRVVKKSKMFFNRKVIFMIPGTWNAGSWSELTNPDINPMLYLANNGYDVYTMDFRSLNVPDMDYDQFSEYGIDISSTTDWTYGVFREDIKCCVDFIKKSSSVKKIFMSGFSRGVTHMTIYASKYQDDLRGLVALDGLTKDMPPSGTPWDEATYNQVVNLFKAGLLVDPDTSTVIPWLYMAWFLDDVNYNNWKLAGVLPYSKNLVGGALPAGFDVISDYVGDSAHHLWDLIGVGEGALTNYHGGYIDRDVLVDVLNEFSRYYPYIQTLEDLQLMAHEDVPYFDYDDNDIYLPMIGFVSKVGCPNYICLIDVIPNITLSDDVTINFLQGYGHMDVLFGTYSLTDVKQPLLVWLNAHMDEGSSQALSWQSPGHQLLDSFLKSVIKPFFQIEEN